MQTNVLASGPSLAPRATAALFGAALIFAGSASVASAAADDSAGASEVVHLPAVEVAASADASAAGLSQPYAGGQVASGGRIGLLGSQDYMSAPFNFTSYTRELIQNQQAASVGEVLLNDPAVRVARGFGNFQQLYLVRGLPIYSDDMSYNGLYGLLPRQYLAAELIERLEVLRGANAFLNGAAPGGSGLGGAVNVMPKRAPNSPLAEIAAGVQTGGQWYGALDVARRFDAGAAGLRLNVVRRDGDTAVDGEASELDLVSLGADYRFKALRVSADIGYQDLRKTASQPSVTIGSGLAVPSAPDAAKSVGQPWTYSNERDTFGTLRAEYDLSGKVTAWIAGGGRRSTETASFANPTVYSAAGDASAYRFDNIRKDDIRTGELGLRADLVTGPVEHKLSASASAFDSKSRNAYAFSNFSGFSYNLYSPVEVSAPEANYYVGGSMTAPRVTERVQTSSFAVADVLSFLKGSLLVTGGLRRQKIENYSYDYNTGAELSAYSKTAVTPVGGLVYRLAKPLAAYGNYIEGLTKGDVAPATSGSVPVANVGEALSPYKTKQLEAGFKFDFGRLGGSVGVYESRKPYAGVDSNGVFRVLGRQKIRGVELSGFGKVSDDVKLLGGVSFLDSESSGRDSIGSPDTQANLGFEWSLPWVPGLALDGRALYTSEQYADSANVQRVPSWKRFDAGLRYSVALPERRSLTLRLRMENLADKNYWASAGGYPGAGYLTVGAPRTLVFSATLSF